MNPAEQEEWILYKKMHANRLYKHSQFTSAFAPYLEALTGSMLLQDPSLQVTLLCNLASCLTRTGNLEEALSLTDAALVIDTSNSRALERRGFVLFSMGYHEEALESLTQCINISTDTAIQNQASSLIQRIGKKKQNGSSTSPSSTILSELTKCINS